MTANNLFLVDSNILIYAYDKQENIKKEKAEELLNKCLNGKISLVVSNQNLSEFSHIALKKLKLEYTQVKIIVDDIINFRGFKKINYSVSTIISAIDITSEFKMSFWDSLLAATMKENSIFNIYTENVKDFKASWLNVVNPFVK